MMTSMGINWNIVLAQLVSLVLFAAWLVLTGVALAQIRRRTLPETARAIWAALIVLVPFVGVIAFWTIRPGADTTQ